MNSPGVMDQLVRGIRVQVSCVAVRNNQLAMIRRLKGDQATIKRIIHAGGHVELGETLEEACAREMYEETGLHVKVSDLKLKGVVSFISRSEDSYHSVCFFFLTHNVTGEFNIAPHEAAKVEPCWIDINEIDSNMDIPDYHRKFTKYILERPNVMNARVEWYPPDRQVVWSILND